MSINNATPEMWNELRTKYKALAEEETLMHGDEAKNEETAGLCAGGYKANAAKVPKEDRVDLVNNPQHYNTGNIECIEAIAESMSNEQFRGYLKGNCMKYLWRYDYKGKAAEDLQKAGWYLNKLIKEVS